MYFFTSDEHYGHNKPFIYESRGFNNIKDHDEALIEFHNSVIGNNDIVIHAGDFSLIPSYNIVREKYVDRLNGKHIFLKGSHDRWLKNSGFHQIWEKSIEKQFVVVCHYSMRTWHRSHYNSWQLFGHSHGKLDPVGKQHDIGVDNNNLYPVSWDEIKAIISIRPDNFNLVKKREKQPKYCKNCGIPGCSPNKWSCPGAY